MNDAGFLKEQNARHNWHPMAHPADSLANSPTIVTHGEGVRIQDVDGNMLLDACGGLWNVNLGFSCQPIVDAMTEQLAKLPYYSTFRGTTSDVVIELSVMLRDFFEPDGLTRAFYTSGGSDSVETALRLARQYHKVTGQHGRTKFISLLRGYHGTHFGGASVNGNTSFRQNYEPLLPGCFHVPAPYLYRNQWDETDAEKLAQRCANALRAEIEFQGADTIAAFIMEPVMGAGGVIPPHASFMPMVRDICTEHGILLIADEVITGFGRTGGWTGSRHYGVKPDLACTAKAITNGYFPFGAVMIAEHVAAAFENDESGKAAIGHGYTYSGHPVGVAAAIACLKETIRLQVHTNAAARGEELLAGLNALADKHSVVGDVRGRGLMCAMELVSDRNEKTPMDEQSMNRFRETVVQNGVMIRVIGHNVIFSPSLVITSDDVSQMISAIGAGLAAI